MEKFLFLMFQLTYAWSLMAKRNGKIHAYNWNTSQISYQLQEENVDGLERELNPKRILKIGVCTN